MHSVLCSELHAIEIVDSAPELICKNVGSLTDSRTACMMLLSCTDYYVSSVDLIRGLLISSNRRSLKIQWVKAYAGIEGNEIVDIGAESTHYKSEISEYPLSLQEDCSHIFKLHKKYCREYLIQDTNLTGVGQFLRSVRGDEFGSCRMGFDRKEKKEKEKIFIQIKNI